MCFKGCGNDFHALNFDVSLVACPLFFLKTHPTGINNILPQCIHSWSPPPSTLYIGISYKVVLEQPDPPPPPHRLAGIKQMLGELREAVTEYTAVLELDSHYVPALKGQLRVCVCASEIDCV